DCSSLRIGGRSQGRLLASIGLSLHALPTRTPGSSAIEEQPAAAVLALYVILVLVRQPAPELLVARTRGTTTARRIVRWCQEDPGDGWLEIAEGGANVTAWIETMARWDRIPG